MSVLQNTPYGRSLKHLEYAALGGRAYQIRKELKQVQRFFLKKVEPKWYG